MNNYAVAARKRRQTLLIVEGSHEKNELFWLLFKCFPEIEIDMNDVWVYGTNIYRLYDDIVKEYGTAWTDEGEDIDLPYVISKKKGVEPLCYKEDFVNIILVFDYERHDPYFSEMKICAMQRRFSDATDMGKLYLNYPMIESYQHLIQLPDYTYESRKIATSLQPGKRYKALVEKETIIGSWINFPHRVSDLLEKVLTLHDKKIRESCVHDLLNIPDTADPILVIQRILQGMGKETEQLTLSYQLADWIKKLKLKGGKSYWQAMRELFKQVIQHNLSKAAKIQGNQYQIEESEMKTVFGQIDYLKILQNQNLESKDNGFIWVLNTCVLFVAEYNFNLIMEA